VSADGLGHLWKWSREIERLDDGLAIVCLPWDIFCGGPRGGDLSSPFSTFPDIAPMTQATLFDAQSHDVRV